ncbi:MAG: head GIN domain-containing protein [Candidatus Neomarinimicrobiota bacterium]
MKKNKILLSFFLILVAGIGFAKYLHVSGPETTQDYRIKNIANLEVSSQIDLYLSQGDEEELIVETYKSLIPHIKVEQNGQRLRVYLDRKVHRLKWNGKKEKINAYLKVKDLDKISLSGACDLYMQTEFETEDLKILANGASDLEFAKIKGKNIHLIMSGASDIDHGEIQAKRIYINTIGASDGALTLDAESIEIIASGASDFNIDIKAQDIKIKALGSSDFKVRGRAKNFMLQASGSSDIQAYDLMSDKVIVKASASSSCRVNSKNSLEANTSGASSIYYKGNPENLKLNITGASSIKNK